MTPSLQSPKKQSLEKQAPPQPILKARKRKRLFWGILSISLVLHGVFLVLPWSRKPLSTSTAQISNETDAVLDDTPLATMPTISLDELRPPSTISEVDTAKEQPANQQQSTESAPQVIQQQTPLPLVQQPVQAIAPIQPQPVRAPTQPAPAANNVQQPDLQPVVQPDDDIPHSHSTERTSLEVDPAQGSVMLLGEDFPDLAGAESGCYGLSGCRQLSGNYRQAAQQLLAQLDAQGYIVKKVDAIDDAGHRVFEAIAPDKPNEVYYLNVFSPGVGSTVYVMAVEILSLAQLEALSQ